MSSSETLPCQFRLKMEFVPTPLRNQWLRAGAGAVDAALATARAALRDAAVVLEAAYPVGKPFPIWATAETRAFNAVAAAFATASSSAELSAVARRSPLMIRSQNTSSKLSLNKDFVYANFRGMP